jgi:hypothetical protein
MLLIKKYKVRDKFAHHLTMKVYAKGTAAEFH